MGCSARPAGWDQASTSPHPRRIGDSSAIKTGPASSTHYGTTSSSLGDVNGDGFDDLSLAPMRPRTKYSVIVDHANIMAPITEYYIDVEYYFSDYAGKAHGPSAAATDWSGLHDLFGAWTPGMGSAPRCRLPAM